MDHASWSAVMEEIYAQGRDRRRIKREMNRVLKRYPLSAQPSLSQTSDLWWSRSTA